MVGLGQNTNNLQAALQYQEKGLSVIPVNPPIRDENGKDNGKKPLIKWEEFQKRIAEPKEIEEWFKRWPDSRVGIVTGEVSGLDVVDVDTKQGEDKLIEALGEELSTFNPPMASTPRGGKHLYVQASGEGNKTGFLPGVDYRGEGGYILAPPSIGLDGTRYEWHPGASLFDLPLAEMPRALAYLFNSLYKHRGGHGGQPSSDLSRLPLTSVDLLNFDQGNRDNTLFHIANCLAKGGMPAKEIELLLALIASKICSPPFPEKEIPVKVQSALKRMESQERNVAGDVRDWVLTSSGFFLTSDLYKELHLTSRDFQKAAVQALLKLVKEGVIEKYGEKRGCYRRVERDYEIIDLEILEDGQPIAVKLPFQMEDLVELMPKDLIVFAGTPNAGKTAVMLETVRLNMASHKCFYFSSELGRYAAKKRLKKHKTCQKWNFKFIDDFPNYLDVIRPDDLNFIDYVEVTDGEYFKIPSLLSGIQKRLKTGLAFVALQKNPETPHAVGGPQTKAKPALFCSIEEAYPGAKIIIDKGKNWISQNPNGLSQNFRIEGGINITPIRGWRR